MQGKARLGQGAQTIDFIDALPRSPVGKVLKKDACAPGTGRRPTARSDDPGEALVSAVALVPHPGFCTSMRADPRADVPEPCNVIPENANMNRLEKRFPKKRILITGATSGFGEALAYALAERGWNIISGRDPAVKRTVKNVNPTHGGGAGLALEVRDKLQWDAARELQEAWGGIDILCNNAGVADSNKLVDMTDADWGKLLSINLDGVINGCPHLRARLHRRKIRLHPQCLVGCRSAVDA